MKIYIILDSYYDHEENIEDALIGVCFSRHAIERTVRKDAFTEKHFPEPLEILDDKIFYTDKSGWRSKICVIVVKEVPNETTKDN